MGIQYLEAWLCGNGCVPIYNLMEDAATAEISRAQLWQWIHHETCLKNGTQITVALLDEWVKDELLVIESEIGKQKYEIGKFQEAVSLFLDMIKKTTFDEFLTLPAYNQL